MSIQATFRFYKQAKELRDKYNYIPEFTLGISRDEKIEKIKQRVYEQFWANGKGKLSKEPHGGPANLNFWANGSGKLIRTTEEFHRLCPTTTDKVEVLCELKLGVAIDRHQRPKKNEF